MHDTLATTPEYQGFQSSIDELTAAVAHLDEADINTDALPPLRIAGAGLAGIFLACYLEKLGITNYEVHEKRSAEDFKTRPNNVQARNDYRKHKDEFKLFETLSRILPAELVEYIQDVSLVFGSRNRPPKHERLDKLVFSVGALQEKALTLLPKDRFHFNSNPGLDGLSDSGALTFNASGARSENDTDLRILRRGNAIDSGHTWSIQLTQTDGDKGWEDFKPGALFGPSCFMANTHMSWTWPIEEATPQAQHDYIFSTNLIKRSIHYLQSQDTDHSDQIEKLQIQLTALETGKDTFLNYRLVHKPSDSDFHSGTLERSGKVLA